MTLSPVIMHSVSVHSVSRHLDDQRALSPVRGRLVALAVAGAVLLAPLFAQASAGTGLLVRILPEARLNQQSVAVTIVVDASGAISSQTAILEAWIRALPVQTVRFVAQSGQLIGPSGSLPAGLLRWQGSALGSTGGGRSAQCTDGAFTGGLDLLASGWGRSGTLTCQVQFTLDATQNPAPGVYTAQVDLALYAQ